MACARQKSIYLTDGIKEIFKNSGFKPKKSLGQNFLTDGDIAGRIAELAEITPDDHIIEVGPGVCALTETLCAKARRVIAVEIDRRLVPIINAKMLRYGNFNLINADALSVSADLLFGGASADIPKKNVKFISNMPYNISTQLMTRLFTEFTGVGKAVLTMQREVADKILAPPSTAEYNAVTVFADSFAKASRAFMIPQHCFTPQPRIDSAVVVFDARDEAAAAAPYGGTFVAVVRAAFANRRKTLENCLLHAGLAPDRPSAANALAQAGLPRIARGESLSCAQFETLAKILHSKYLYRN